MHRSLRHTLVMLTLSLSTIGCDSQQGPPPKGEGVAVSGKALLPSGSPLTGGVLVFRPQDGLYGVSGLIQSDGRFTLADSAGEQTVVPGKYKVYVTFKDPKIAQYQRMINSRYQQSEDGDSDIIVDITKATTDLTIKFKR